VAAPLFASGVFQEKRSELLALTRCVVAPGVSVAARPPVLTVAGRGPGRRNGRGTSEYECVRELHGKVWCDAFVSEVQQWVATVAAAGGMHAELAGPPTTPQAPATVAHLQELEERMATMEAQLESALTSLRTMRAAGHPWCRRAQRLTHSDNPPVAVPSDADGHLDAWEQDYLALVVSDAVTAARARQTERLHEAMRLAYSESTGLLAQLVQALPVAGAAAEAEPTEGPLDLAARGPAEPEEQDEEIDVEDTQENTPPDAVAAAAPIDPWKLPPAVPTSSPGKLRARVSRVSAAATRTSPYARRLRSTSDSAVPPPPAPTSAAPAAVAPATKRATTSELRRPSVVPRRQTLTSSASTTATAATAPVATAVTATASRATRASLSATPVAAAPAPTATPGGPAAGTRLRRTTMTTATSARPPLADANGKVRDRRRHPPERMLSLLTKADSGTARWMG